MIVEIMHTANLLELEFAAILKSYELTTAQYNILRILRGASPAQLGVGEIRNRMISASSDVSRLIDRLVSKELVVREVCEKNRRKMDVYISEKGLDVLKQLDILVADLLKGMDSEALADNEVLRLTDSLKHIRESINNSKK